MQHMSMFMWLATKIDQLEQAGITQDEVAITITEIQEKMLLKEVEEVYRMRAYSAHHAEFCGWRIIVKGRNQ